MTLREQREKSVLVTLIMHPELYHLTGLSREHFTKQKDTAKIVFKQVEEGEISFVTVSNELGFDISDWYTYIDSDNIEDNSAFIIDEKFRDDMMNLALEIAELYKNGSSGDDMASKVSSVLALQSNQILRVESVAEIVVRLEAELAQRATGKFGLKLGIKGLDDLIQGLVEGDLMIIGARPGMAKTALSLQMTSNVNNAGKAVFYACLEMRKEAMTNRLAAIEIGQNPRHRITPEVEQWLNDAREKKKNFFIDWPMSFQDFKKKARYLRYKHKVELIVFDYIQLVATNEEEVSKVSRQLKVLAGELEVPIIAISQLNREVERRKDKRPIVSDLRHSGALEQDADIILLLYRQNQYSNDRSDESMEIIIGKHREGMKDTIEGLFKEKIMKFVEKETKEITIFENEEEDLPF